jgi:hypothetical protein
LSAKPSPSEEIVELRAPDGNSVTHKVYRSDTETVKFFLSKGYTIVEPEQAS